MQIVEFKYPNVPTNTEDLIVCLGFFDGIHLGHQSIFKKARKEGYKVAAFTFDNTPAYVVGKINEQFYSSALYIFVNCFSDFIFKTDKRTGHFRAEIEITVIHRFQFNR